MEMNFEYQVDDHTAKFLLNKFIHYLYGTEKLSLEMIKQHLNLSAFADDSEIIEALKKND